MYVEKKELNFKITNFSMIGLSRNETFGVTFRRRGRSSALDERLLLRIGDSDRERKIFGWGFDNF